MERKWYLDLWALIRAPFKRGIPEIVEFGTIQRGFACAMGMLAISLLVSWIIQAGMSYSLGASALQLGAALGVLAGAGFFRWSPCGASGRHASRPSRIHGTRPSAPAGPVREKHSCRSWPGVRP